MQFKRLGNTGLIVSRLAFGSMTFGSDPNVPSVAKPTTFYPNWFNERLTDAPQREALGPA